MYVHISSHTYTHTHIFAHAYTHEHTHVMVVYAHVLDGWQGSRRDD